MSVRILQGDCRDVLQTLPSESVDCIVTSPPYYGLRDYGTAEWSGGKSGCDHRKTTDAVAAIEKSTLEGGKKTSGHLQEGFKTKCGRCGAHRVDRQIGLEETPDAYVKELVSIFRDCRRVLKDTGTCWINLGDSYAGGGNYRGTHSEETLSEKQRSNGGARGVSQLLGAKNTPGCKPKDLLGIPWLVAFAFRDDGWWLRQDIIWSKPNPMPESVTDRCTKAHEYIFLLSKSGRYFYDADAIAEPLAYGSVGRLSQDVENQAGSDRVPGKTNGTMKAVYKAPYTGASTKDYASGGAQDASATKARIVDKILSGELVTRNKRSVWEVTTQPFSEAHFATFPPALIEPCIKAGCPEGGMVLDPFFGAGTTGLVADRLQRDCIGIELNPAYATMAQNRISNDAGMFGEVAQL